MEKYEQRNMMRAMRQAREEEWKALEERVRFYLFYWMRKDGEWRYSKSRLESPWQVWIQSQKKLGWQEIQEMAARAHPKCHFEIQKRHWIVALEVGSMWDVDSVDYVSTDDEKRDPNLGDEIQ